jgi:hypothetical protein
MTERDFGILLFVVLLIWWRLERKLNEVIRQVGLLREPLLSLQEKADEIGESASAIAVNIATRK